MRQNSKQNFHQGMEHMGGRWNEVSPCSAWNGQSLTPLPPLMNSWALVAHPAPSQNKSNNTVKMQSQNPKFQDPSRFCWNKRCLDPETSGLQTFVKIVLFWVLNDKNNNFSHLINKIFNARCTYTLPYTVTCKLFQQPQLLLNTFRMGLIHPMHELSLQK